MLNILVLVASRYFSHFGISQFGYCAQSRQTYSAGVAVGEDEYGRVAAFCYYLLKRVGNILTNDDILLGHTQKIMLQR